MMSNNKILTVSYGTFSCTLEGFDDYFGTMKAIAEYFRDLASDDRYFGAEPPQPDTEMLSRIAQKEISRRVEVREHEGKIVLSATDIENDSGIENASSTTLAAPADVKETQTNAQAEAMIATEAVRAAKAQEQAETIRVQANAEAEAEKAEAARLEDARAQDARIEAGRVAAQAAGAKAEAEKAYAETPAPAASELVARDLAAELPEADAFFATNTPTLEDDDADNKAEDSATIAQPIAKAEAAAPVQDDSIAAKLQRIRAVVSNADHADEDDDFSEDEHAENFGTEKAAKAIADTPAEVAIAKEETQNTDDFDIANFSVDTSIDEKNDIAIDVKADAIADIQAANEADELADALENSADLEDDDVSSILANLEANGDDNAADDVKDITVDALAEENLFEDSVNAADDAEPDLAAEAVEPRRVARVIKVKRADLEAAISQGDLEEIDDDDDIIENLIDSSLSDEDEAELARELADAQVLEEDDSFEDVALENDHESLFEDATFEDTAASNTRAPLDENDDDLSRLLAEADQQMDDEEGKQNRDAFAHLRAAVSAKNADAGLSEPTAEEEEGAYRSDLATAVRPRRPSTDDGAKRVDRPVAADRPEPLKLFAEQRVDTSATETRGPVRPRRVALQETAMAADTGSFVDFAEDVGARELPDLLEAAASYMSFVEGREQFSRPQLMNKVRSVEKENFSREDGLRQFGMLLRAGKIEKIKGGRFAVTDDINYRPDTRAAG